jgi:hypothetical protein
MRSCPGQPSRLNGRSESCGSVVNRRLTEALVFGFLMPHRAETPTTRSQQHLERRATPVLHSIHQLRHVSCGLAPT